MLLRNLDTVTSTGFPRTIFFTILPENVSKFVWIHFSVTGMVLQLGLLTKNSDITTLTTGVTNAIQVTF